MKLENLRTRSICPYSSGSSNNLGGGMFEIVWGRGRLPTNLAHGGILDPKGWFRDIIEGVWTLYADTEEPLCIA